MIEEQRVGQLKGTLMSEHEKHFNQDGIQTSLIRVVDLGQLYIISANEKIIASFLIEIRINLAMFRAHPLLVFPSELISGTGEHMSINLFKDKGTPLASQKFTWKDLVQKPISKYNDDAFTRLRVILLNGVELEAVRFSHMCARMNKDLQKPLALMRRVEHHQATLINWLLSADHSPLETTIAYEQVAIEMTAAFAQKEPDEYLAQVYRFGLLEDFDHMYRYSALMDRVEGKDANTILQSYTDIIPGRPTIIEHRDPLDDLRHHYVKEKTEAITKFHALTIWRGNSRHIITT